MNQSRARFLVFIIGTLLLTLASFPPGLGAQSPVDGKTIALDAGHGGGDPGAVGYCGDVAISEVDVNLVTRAALRDKLTAAGATVFDIPQLASRRDRVAAAESAGADILISIHHNGSTNLNANYTQSFVTQKNDRTLASFIHPQLVAALDLPDRGIKNDGYGMTVYGSLPGVLTESYFITNPTEACAFDPDAGGGPRVQSEADALFVGIVEYFSSSGQSKGKGRK